jgi:hypothetical protein
MSSDTLPITPARFAAALRDLPISTLHLKAAELRNSIAHLDYSNEQLKPFAYPSQYPSSEAAAVGSDGAAMEGDQDCEEAIKENEIVIQRMEERIGLLKAEAERRGLTWTEFMSTGEAEKTTEGSDGGVVNGHRQEEAELVNGAGVGGGVGGAGNGNGEQRHSAWTDGTFSTGRISGGEVVMDDAQGMNGLIGGGASGRIQTRGGMLGDDELRRRMEERMRESMQDEDDDEGGMHL